MSLDAIRNKILSSSSEERVEVNQRLLVDKILARYSTEFVVYRELMQNSDDAESQSIEIRFETNNNNEVIRIQFKNNGFAFRSQDWDRVKKIAEGNPDEQKIGAFGIGFYSLFSICEEPFISSGGQGMAFFWQQNQLFTKRGPTGDDVNGWTTFLMDMREPMELPNIEIFAQFLANSLGFTEYLQEVSVFINDKSVIQLSKTMGEPRLMEIPSEFDTFSPEKMFCLTSANVRDIQLEVNFPAEGKDDSIFFRIASGDLGVYISDEFSAEMERITKKRPPNNTTIQMIFTGYDSSPKDYISPVFEDLLPYPEQGRIYIGFPTHQTTGCCSHLAARVIPTVERESIDLVQRTLARYNGEILCLAGTLCRILYENEMIQVARLSDDYVRERRAVHALIHFTFDKSTPNEQVGSIMESQFFNCSEQELYILSTDGVLPISKVRMPNSEMAGFIQQIPVVPKNIARQCYTFFKKAKARNLIKDLDFQDVLTELRRRPLSEDEMIELLKWWISYRSKGNSVNRPDFENFMKSARIGGNRALNTIRYVLNRGIISSDDVPDDVLPYNISRNFNNQNLVGWLGWSELSLVNWAKFIVDKPDLETDSEFAEEVHQIIARNFKKTSKNDKGKICQLFSRKRCIPTNFGMKFPNEAYFQNVNLFPDLPTIRFHKPFSVQNLMEFLGVRKVVELNLIFDRLINQENCDHMMIIKYLASKLGDLKENEIKLLRNEPIWPKKNSQQTRRFIAGELYAPYPQHIDLGLPVIDWRGRWIRNTDEVKFLNMLGVQEYPRLVKILELAAPPIDAGIRSKALKYFIDNFEKKYSQYYNPNVNIAFLPCTDPDIYAKPSDCYINLECKIMKFKVIHQSLRFHAERIGVCQHPNREKLLNRLMQDPPQDEKKAKKIFEYLASQQTCFTRPDWNKLADFDFIPFRDDENSTILIKPRSCFFIGQKEMFNDFFRYVDFGEKANEFLQRCGVKNEPSPIDYAELLVKSSDKLWKSIDISKYLSILQIIAVDFSMFGTIASRSSLFAKMKEARVLVAIKKQPSEKESNNEGENLDNKENNEYYLTSAKKIFINDYDEYRQVFNPLIAPEEDILEILYKKLGCRSLHNSVKETSIPKGTHRKTEKSKQIQNLIIERAGLFYFKHPKNGIKRDEEWLKKIKVKEIDYVETRYILDNNSKSRKTNTIILKDTLYMSIKSDLLEVSKHIAKNIYKLDKSDEFKDISLLYTVLTTPIPGLKILGYPVDRILQQPDLQDIVDIQMKIIQENEINAPSPSPNSNDVEYPINRTIQPHAPSTSSNSKDVEYSINRTIQPHAPSPSKDVEQYSINRTIQPPNLQHINKVRNNQQVYNPLPNNNSPVFFHNTINYSQPHIITSTYANKELFNITSETTQIIRNFLQDAIKVCYSNSESNANDQTDSVKADLDVVIDRHKIVNEYRMSYCEVIPGHSLQCVGNFHGIEFYIPKDFDQSEIIPQANIPLNRFINMLKDLADVFELLPKDIHIFYDKNSNSIAFNRDRELFFNFRLYLELHEEECKLKHTINAMTYWFMMFCHELAHNFISLHNSEHEYYFLLFAESYMSSFLDKMKKREIL